MNSPKACSVSFRLSLALFLTVLTARADVRLHNLFSDNMVLQRDASVPVWGWADDGEEVTVTFRGQTARTKAKNGKWMVHLKKLEAGGPDTFSVSGKNEIKLENVLVGEVWVASGQSNMEFPLKRSHEAANDIAQSANAKIRLFTVPKLKAEEPTNNVNASWQECNPQSVPDFSAVAYYFGRDLQKALGVPVGIIHTSWGGSPAEVWMSEKVLSSNRDYRRNILESSTEGWKRYENARAKYAEAAAAAKKAGNPFTERSPRAPWRPTELYNGMIAPLLPYAIKGAIWYQGESNAGRAWQYRSLFTDMIENWRHDWHQGKFPFLLVQLAPWDRNKKRSLEEITASPGESDWAELREAQVYATRALPNVGLAVITDVGDKDDIHPTKKEPVGARLALAALGVAYDKDIVYSGPTFKKMKVEEGKAILSFDDTGSGLVAREGDLKGFAIAGPDREFVWANAKIEGDKVIVSSPKVEKPVAVRYGWADYPVVNLWNKEGLPASPFRTDKFPVTTQPKPEK